MATAAVATSTPFCCRDAIRQLCKRSQLKNTAFIENEIYFYVDECLVTVIKKHFYAAFELFKLCRVPVCIIGRKIVGDKNKYSCLLDIRHLDSVFTLKHIKPLYWIIDTDSGVLLKETTKAFKIPPLNYYKRKYHQLSASLWDILQLPVKHKLHPEPQSAQELKQILLKYNLLSQTNVFYSIMLVPQHELPWVMGHTDSQVAPLCFFAYTKPDLTIGYAFRQPGKLNHFNLPMFEEECRNLEDSIPDASTVNRRTSVSVKLGGLLLAHKLGICTKEEMHQYSQALASCVGAIWVTFDEEKHVRHAVYHDGHHNTKAIELKCVDHDWNVKQWTEFFKYIQKCAAAMKEIKAGILTQVTAALHHHSSNHIRSPWSRCWQQLQTNAIGKHKVFVFCNDDTVLHEIKVPIAGVYKKPKSNGIYLQTLANYTLTSLATTGMVFINLAEYFNFRGKIFRPYDDDDVLWRVAQDYLVGVCSDEDCLMAWSHPELKHDIGQTTKCYVLQRGVRNARIICQLWSALVEYTLSDFHYEIASLPHLSLAKMSFDIMWYNYSLEAGPFAHPLENLHPYTVYKLRPWCKGGFSYSFKDYLKVGKPLGPNKEEAKSIRELDLTSAYGYSGMTMNAAKGFGIVFGGNDVKTQKRYKSFEYMATMYTIFKLTMMEGKEIKSVFSNYSPLGLMYIGKYALDLVVVMAGDNSVKLYQFDGHFCHGDYNNRNSTNCPSLPNYANLKTRHECEQRTMERDEAILNWLMSTDGQFNATYDVLTDCCHPEYSRENLAKAFYIYHPLKDFICGLDKLDGSLDCVDYAEVTFLAIVEGHTRYHQDREFGPIFLADAEPERHTTTGGKILLTSDYYLYLKNNFGFKVTSIEWIIYYKVCEDLPKVFKRFVTMRKQVESGSPKDAFLKTIVNYACGYFGLNSDKQAKMTARIAYKLPKRFNIFKDDVTPLDSFGSSTLMLVKSYRVRKKAKHLCSTPLILFVQIIEFGKQKLNRAVQCLQQYVRPTAMHILYSNVDNLILALSTDTIEEALLNPESHLEFYRIWRHYAGQGPGLLKQEWCHTSNEMWRFISPCRMYHVVLTLNQLDAHHKSTFFTGLPSEEAFRIAMAILRKQNIKVLQEKKKEKLAGTETHIVAYNY
jgi:hypothetical protein